MSESTSATWYVERVDLDDISALESKCQELLNDDIQSVEDLEAWLKREKELNDAVLEAMTAHEIEFVCDTTNAEKRDRHVHDQTAVYPVLMKFAAELDKKFCNNPFTSQLDEQKYGLMRKQRETKVKLFREENIPLTVREQELVTKYNEIMGGLTIEWEGEERPYPDVMPLLDSPDRSVRERGWKAAAAARAKVKGQMDEILNELISLRHQMAQNAGFENFRDYMFEAKGREYTIEECYNYHQATEDFVVPVMNRLSQLMQRELGVETYRPWDFTAKSLDGAPFSKATELMDQVDTMLEQTDADFVRLFRHMRENGLLDLEVRPGKSPGGFCAPLPISEETFIFANFSPSFFAISALVHEMGHAVNFYSQLGARGYREENFRMEVAELYSHSMELLTSDKLNQFYPNERDFRAAQREVLRRAMAMLTGPLSGDLFQHWLYTHPEHTVEERDAKHVEIMKRFVFNAVDISGCEDDMASEWFSEPHVTAYPFYNIEYSMSEVGAVQLFEIYRKDPKRAVEYFKQGAATDFEQPIADIFRDTGVAFDFTEPVLKRVAAFLEEVITELQ